MHPRPGGPAGPGQHPPGGARIWPTRAAPRPPARPPCPVQDEEDEPAPAPAAAAEEEDELNLDLDLTKKKKKKKKVRAEEFGDDGGEEAAGGVAEEKKSGNFAWSGQEREYHYDELLGGWRLGPLGAGWRAVVCGPCSPAAAAACQVAWRAATGLLVRAVCCERCTWAAGQLGRRGT